MMCRSASALVAGGAGLTSGLQMVPADASGWHMSISRPSDDVHVCQCRQSGPILRPRIGARCSGTGVGGITPQAPGQCALVVVAAPVAAVIALYIEPCL